MIVPNSIQFWIILYATVAVVIIKFSIVMYLSVKIHKRKKEGSLAVPFMRGFMLLILCLFISRLFYMAFDFYFTTGPAQAFDQTLYANHPGVYFWQIAQFITSIGLGIITFMTDRILLNFKFKGIFAYIVLAGGIFALVYPVNNFNDFNFVETVGILPDLGLIVTFACLVNIAVKTTGIVRRNASILIVAIVCYIIASLVVNASVINGLTTLLGIQMDVYVYLMQAILKIIGITLMAYGASRWM